MITGNAMNRPLACFFVALALTSAAAAKDLVGVYEDALKSDPQIRQADANRLASREARPQAWPAVLPQLSGTLSMTREKQDGTEGSLSFDQTTGTPFPITTPFVTNSTAKSWGLNLRENVFSWSNWMAIKQADIQVAQAQATYQAAQQNL